MKIRQYQVDAFARRPFEGNPAAVVPLETWLTDETLQLIANENNLSETAFFVPEGDGFHLRWFTPVSEVDLCGHATLASAHVVLNTLGLTTERVAFRTRSGVLTVERDGDLLVMDFPALPPEPCVAPACLAEGLGVMPIEVLAATDYIAVLASERQVRELQPDMRLIAQAGLRGVGVTACGEACDFVSRFFAPLAGIPEDPVTGSLHCELVPYWAARLGRTSFHARQVSRRGGDVWCELRGDRVTLAGAAVLFMDGVIDIGDKR